MTSPSPAPGPARSPARSDGRGCRRAAPRDARPRRPVRPGRLRPHPGRRDRGPRRRQHRGGWAPLAGPPGLGDRRVRHAARGDRHPQRPGAAWRRRALQGDRAARRPLAAGRPSNLDALPDVTVTVDCDVLAADGGTRTASITGGWVALAVALGRAGLGGALIRQVAAVSVGVVDGAVLLDLDQREDNRAAVDMNVVAADRRAARRGAGHRRGRAVPAGAARRARRRGAGRLRRADVPPACGARCCRARPVSRGRRRHRQRAQARGDRPAPGRRRTGADARADG